MKAIIIGAGKIGRGFIGQVLYQSGYTLTFIDTSGPLVEELNRMKQYPVTVLGADEQEMMIEKVKAFKVDDPEAVFEFTEASIVTTAVGPSVLIKTAGYVSAGIKARFAKKITSPLTIVACENMESGTTVLFREVEKLLTDEESEFCKKYVGFPDAEVSRMVIPMEGTCDHQLAVKVEQYMEWAIDQHNVKDDLSHIKNLECTDNIAALIKRKIYSLTGHAMLGYMGYKKNFTYIYESAFDEEIFDTVYRALLECGKGWSHEYQMKEEEFNLYTTIMLRRFSDTRLKDPVARVSHQPIRKLDRNERFIGPALTCLKHSIDPTYIIQGVLFALEYDNPEDEQALLLQSMLRQQGIEYVLQFVCGLGCEEPLYGLLLDAYKGRQTADG